VVQGVRFVFVVLLSLSLLWLPRRRVWEARLLPLSPPFGAGRQTGNGKIVRRHSLDRLNMSMNKQNKNKKRAM